MRGAPQSGFSMLICRSSARSSIWICGRPPREFIPTPIATKTGPMPMHERLRPNDCENPQDCWKSAIQLGKEPAIMVREPDAPMQPAPQDNQLMSKHRVLGFKP